MELVWGSLRPCDGGKGIELDKERLWKTRLSHSRAAVETYCTVTWPV